MRLCHSPVQSPAPAKATLHGSEASLKARDTVVMIVGEKGWKSGSNFPRTDVPNCYRVGLLGPPLRARGARLRHILPDGSVLELDESRLFSIW